MPKINDRGTMKWESSKMMLPEQEEMLQRLWESQNDVEMPSLSEDQLEMINSFILAAIKKHEEIRIKYHENKRFRTVECNAKRVLDNRLEILTENGVDFIRLDKIIDVDYV